MAQLLPAACIPTFLLLVCPLVASADQGLPKNLERERIRQAFAVAPLAFEVNQGQADSGAAFISRRGAASFSFFPNELRISLPVDSVGRARTLRLAFEQGRARRVEGLDRLLGHASYFIGNDPARWYGRIATFGRVRYEQVYDGVDVVWYGNPSHLESDFVVAPGADPRVIKLRIDGGEAPRLMPNGDAEIAIGGDVMRLSKPVVYQEVRGVRKFIDARYQRRGRRTLGFAVAPYDRALPLIIDPVVVFSTFLGGTGHDSASGVAVDGSGNSYVVGTIAGMAGTSAVTKLNATGSAVLYSAYLGGSGAQAIAVDASGHAYVTGHTGSPNFPTFKALQPTMSNPFNEAFITKFTADGSGLVFSTYFGGGGPSISTGIALDDAGNVYITGVGEVPMKNAQDFAGRMFFAKLDTNGAALWYSTRFGSSRPGLVNGIAVGATRTVYLAGRTDATDFPLLNASQSQLRGTDDGFVAGFSPNVQITTLLQDNFDSENGGVGASPYLDFSNWDPGGAVDLVGFTPPVVGATVQLGRDLVSGSLVSKSAFTLGGSGSIFPAANSAFYRAQVTLAGAQTGVPGSRATVRLRIGSYLDEAFVVEDAALPVTIRREFGATIPTEVRIELSYESGTSPVMVDDITFSELAEAPALSFSTYVGGSGSDAAASVAAGPAGTAVIAGSTTSTDFPAVAADLPGHAGGGTDAFVARFDAKGSLMTARYLGGSGADEATAVAVDADGAVYVAGTTGSTDLPVIDATQPGLGGGAWDAYIAKFRADLTFEFLTYLGGGDSQETATGIALDQAGAIHVVGYTDSADFPAVNAVQPFFGGIVDAWVVKMLATPGPRVVGLTQSVGGNTGLVSTQIFGANFPTGPVTVRLFSPGKVDVVAQLASVIDGGRIAVTFDLSGAITGLYDLQIVFSDGHTLNLAAGFTIESGGEPEVFVDIIGRTTVRQNTPTRYVVVVGNRGTVDAIGVPVTIAVPSTGVDIVPKFEIADGPGPPPSQIVPNQIVSDDQLRLPLFIPLVPAGQSRTLPVEVTSRRPQFDFEAWAEQPYLQSSGKQIVANAGDAFACIGGLVIAGFSGAGIGLSGVNAFRLALLAKEIEVATMAVNGSLNDPVALAQLVNSTASETIDLDGHDHREFFQDVVDAFPGVAACKRLLDQLNDPMRITTVGSFDPNAKSGSLGSGAGRHLSGAEPLRYAISFENLPSATAAARDVVVTDTLDPEKVELGSVSLGPVGFGDVVVAPPPGSSSFSTTVNLPHDPSLTVRIAGALNRSTGELKWIFSTLDALSGEPPDDPIAGFLPPNANPPEGDGSVFFTVKPKNDLPTGTVISNSASITFDNNAPINTDTWSNTLDNTPPQSQVAPLPSSQCGPSISVSWSGSDIGAGVRDYRVFVAIDGGPPVEWLTNVSETSASYVGSVGHSYAFYSVARDQAGNIEDAPDGPDAVIALSDNVPPVLSCPASFSVPAIQPTGAPVSFLVSATDSCGPAPTTTCDVATGTFLPIGVNPITCVAIDAAANTANCGFTATVTGAVEQLADLATMVEALSLLKGLEQSLLAKLKGSPACGPLRAFMNEVTAKTGKGISSGAAAALLQTAGRVRSVLGC